MNLADLRKTFPPSEIEWRVGSTNSEKTSGLALAYLTARHVMDRLDEVCGSENWQDRYEFHGTRTICYLSIRIGTEWITKADGAGDSDVEAEKGAISDALKRAAVKWGIGRYLYDLGNIWVDVEAAGRSVRIKRDQYAKLETALVKQFGGAPSVATGAQSNYEVLNAAITSAADLGSLQVAWANAKADATTTPSEKLKLIAAKDARKIILTATPKNLGAHLDNLKAQEDALAANPNQQGRRRGS